MRDIFIEMIRVVGGIIISTRDAALEQYYASLVVTMDIEANMPWS